MRRNLHNLSCFVNCISVKPSASGFKTSVLLSLLFSCSKCYLFPQLLRKKLCLPHHRHPKSLFMGWSPNLTPWVSEQGKPVLGLGWTHSTRQRGIRIPAGRRLQGVVCCQLQHSCKIPLLQTAPDTPGSRSTSPGAGWQAICNVSCPGA